MCCGIQVPLLSGPETLAAYKALAGSDPPAAVKAGYDKAQATAAVRKDLETAIAAGKPADMDLLASYMAYVTLEQVIVSQLESWEHYTPLMLP